MIPFKHSRICANLDHAVVVFRIVVGALWNHVAKAFQLKKRQRTPCSTNVEFRMFETFTSVKKTLVV